MFYMFFQVLSRTLLLKAQLSKSWITASFDCNVITFLWIYFQKTWYSDLNIYFSKNIPNKWHENLNVNWISVNQSLNNWTQCYILSYLKSIAVTYKLREVTENQQS